MNNSKNNFSLFRIICVILISIGVIQIINSAKDRADWYDNYYGVNPNERIARGDEISEQTELGGVLIGAGLGAWLLPSYLSKNKRNKK